MNAEALQRIYLMLQVHKTVVDIAVSERDGRRWYWLNLPTDAKETARIARKVQSAYSCIVSIFPAEAEEKEMTTIAWSVPLEAMATQQELTTDATG